MNRAVKESADTLYIICDTSGSMFENGKPMIMRGVAGTAGQYIRLYGVPAGIKLLSWNKNISEVEWNADDEYPEKMLKYRAPSEGCPPADFFETITGGKILLLSDGFWTGGEGKIFKELESRLPPGAVRIITIGPDYNPYIKSGNISGPDEILGVLDEWFHASNAEARGGEL